MIVQVFCYGFVAALPLVCGVFLHRQVEASKTDCLLGNVRLTVDIVINEISCSVSVRCDNAVLIENYCELGCSLYDIHLCVTIVVMTY